MQSHSDFIKEIESVATEVEQELKKRQEGSKGDGTIGQLTLALSELKKLKNMVLSDKLPPKEKRWLEITWFITDSWGDNSALGHKLLVIADKYKAHLGLSFSCGYGSVVPPGRIRSGRHSQKDGARKLSKSSVQSRLLRMPKRQ